MEQAPEEFAKMDSRDGFFEKYPVPDSCSGCRYFKTCYGGCLHDRYAAGYPYKCKSNRIYWDHLVKWLEKKGLGLYALEKSTPQEAKQIMVRLFDSE